jgi:hypothetical protein
MIVISVSWDSIPTYCPCFQSLVIWLTYLSLCVSIQITVALDGQEVVASQFAVEVVPNFPVSCEMLSSQSEMVMDTGSNVRYEIFC